MALILSKNPYLTPAQVSQILEESAHALSETKSNSFGSGQNRMPMPQCLQPLTWGSAPWKLTTAREITNGKINPGELINLPVTLVNTTEETYPGCVCQAAVHFPICSD
jgi:hypothetical protein